MSPPSTNDLEIRLLGTLEVLRDGVTLTLPPSRKTRALLGYLVATARPARRAWLCDLLWQGVDDPRGGLRWSVSRLRRLVDEPSVHRIAADRQTVAFVPDGARLDLDRVRTVLDRSPDRAPLDVLEQAAADCRGPFLDGLDLDDHHSFQAWLTAQREHWRRAHLRIRAALVERLGHAPERALAHARVLVAERPEDEGHRSTLVRLLAATERMEEAEEHVRQGLSRVGGAGTGELRATWRSIRAPAARRARPMGDMPTQEVRFTRSADRVRIAWASLGDGPPVVKTGNWLTHLEYDWKSPIWRHLARELGASHRLIRYDQRCNGLSDWQVEDVSFDAFLADLEAVVDAAGLQRFSLLGISQGCALAIGYALRHPERVQRLVLYGGYARGAARGTPERREQKAAMRGLMKVGWGADNPVFRQLFASLFMPGADAWHMELFDELQQVACSPENAVRTTEATSKIDLVDRLAEVSVPTLVMHAVDDAMVPLEEGRLLAAGIPGARFVPLESGNHLLLHDEPAWARLIEELRAFLGEERA